MKIFLATDHAGFTLKEYVKEFLLTKGHDVVDGGAHSLNENDDYPDYIKPTAEEVSKNGNSRGIIFGGTGQGEAVVANRIRGVRAVVYYGGSKKIITLSREHNDANILSLGARFLSKRKAVKMIELWLNTSFSQQERHTRRIEKIDN
tara:strand:+ start:82 stop:522 length:441 start_codon:yes stop_codon:yes gene_type:complete